MDKFKKGDLVAIEWVFRRISTSEVHGGYECRFWTINEVWACEKNGDVVNLRVCPVGNPTGSILGYDKDKDSFRLPEYAPSVFLHPELPKSWEMNAQKIPVRFRETAKALNEEIFDDLDTLCSALGWEISTS